MRHSLPAYSRRACLILALLLAACNPVEQLNRLPSPDELAGQTAAAPTARPTQQATPVPTAEPTEVPVRTGQFQIDQTSTSSQEALTSIELVLRRADVADDQITLRVAFQNTADQGYQILGTLSGNDAVLADADGNEYEPITVSEKLATSINPEGGFTPGGANVGELVFPLPEGPQPYELRVPTYAPIAFSLDTPLEAQVDIPPGDYPVAAAVRSTEDALRQIELQIQSIRLTDDQLTFAVAFANIGRQGYTLLVGPKGEDARLLDGEGQQYEPQEVSPSLAASIAPQDGWEPGQANTGTLTFPRPEALNELRLVFPAYDALTVSLDADGVAETRVTSASGGAPQPTPVPSAEEVAFGELEQVLAAQAEALLSGDAAGYLATFDQALQTEQSDIIGRVATVPLISATLRLAANTDIPEGDNVERLPVELTYGLEGIVADNPFLHDLRYSFTRTANGWQVTAVELGENPPFWMLGNVVVRRTPHFLIFARPEAEAELPTLEQESEAAYAALTTRGLTLEPQYVAYFTASGDDFNQLTGRPANRVLGLALSRYQFSGNSVSVNSRAFYINGEAFAQEGQATDARQTTITHELVHLALASQTRPYSPPWLVEGAAVYYSEDLSDAQRQQLLTDGRLDTINLEDLTRAETLGEHDLLGQQTSYEYIFSGETFAYLVERYGEAQVLEFYRSYANVPADQVRDRMPQFGGSEVVVDAVFTDLRAQLTADAVQQFFGVSLAQVDADVKARLRDGS